MNHSVFRDYSGRPDAAIWPHSTSFLSCDDISSERHRTTTMTITLTFAAGRFFTSVITQDHPVTEAGVC